MKTKILAGVITGTVVPRHIQVAYGRHVYRLLHVGFNSSRPSLYMRDLPMSLWELDYNGYPHALMAYRAECWVHGLKMEDTPDREFRLQGS